MKYIISIALILFLISCDTTKGFQIDVTVQGVPNGRSVILKKQINRKIINLDTTTIENGKFSFKGTIKEPMMLGMFIDSLKNGRIIPILDVNDHLTITGHKDSLQKAIIKGSKLQDVLTVLRNKRDELNSASKKYLPEFQKARQNQDTATIERINNLLKATSDTISENEWAFVKNNPKSFVAPLIFSGLMGNPKYEDSLRIVFNNFSEEIKKSDLCLSFKERFSYSEKNKKPNKK